MNEENQLKISKSIFIVPIVFVVSIWVIYWIEIQFDFNFNKYGVFPRTLDGFKGVFFTHFIHSNTSHLFNNSIPLFVLLSSLFYFYKDVAFKVLLLGGFFSGFLTWCIARESYHIGASGIVYLLFSFVFFSGMIKKHFRLVALSLIIIFLYGSMIWYVLPIKEGMSWEGHLSSFLVGLIFAFIFKNKGIVKKEHQFTETEFDTMFDENGNFVPPVLEEENESSEVE
ncbi:rhomboid family intramembrane serine protease [Polaribacter reichenbachii]|uniref:Rhomboid family intramembrane serine protease n=1 Tax=Polaribacter reichenbachii TaxID=996801 RepID=A0A1B8TVZ8_9FLAO|nr:rhomboid family intramembrane serine protease [Polaribacter reichenbachii]APZ45075.1 rhomboid family intramembrane serine protease [Polaribacter reichenbachii]AUC18937.1 rhomboid family intramembrane serine protease [Polaribacter reichenbachii]OBY63906.1 rhomboid family intramembrane serine protease [Polaribacter reichenbachii]